MIYDLRSHKIVAVLSSKIAPGVALNVVGHLSISIGASVDREAIMGRETLRDASGIDHLGIARYSYIIKSARPAKLRLAIERARTIATVVVADYPQQMLSTGHDDELFTALASAQENSLEYLGAVFFGPTVEIDDVVGKFSLWVPPGSPEPAG